LTEGWQTATLAEKIPERILGHDSDIVARLLESEARGLRAEWQFHLNNGWIDIRAKGEDAEALVNLLQQRYGRAPGESSRVERWDVCKGFITGSGKVGFGVYVDIGIMQPTRKDALYPLHRMRAQLADGVSKPCREILDENALVDYLPVKVVVTEVDGEKLSVELADETRELLLSWKRLPFDRVLAVGVRPQQAENAVKSAGLQYDVIKVETLSPFFQCLLCKIGTEAPGIIAKIGGRLRGARLASFRTPVHLQ
jgi:hypothetical protein